MKTNPMNQPNEGMREPELSIKDLYLPENDPRNIVRKKEEVIFGNPKGNLGERFEYKLPFLYGRIKKEFGENSLTRISEFIQSEIDLALAKQRSELMEGLTDLFDRLESNDPDTSTENWRNYKFIRNNIRYFFSTITKDTKD